jgi:cadmium resistance protein CadD (predicted permease)
MENTQGTAQQPPEAKSKDRGGVVGGTILVVVGLLFLADNFIPGFRIYDFWPLILIALGVGLLWKSWKQA